MYDSRKKPAPNSKYNDVYGGWTKRSWEYIEEVWIKNCVSISEKYEMMGSINYALISTSTAGGNSINVRFEEKKSAAECICKNSTDFDDVEESASVYSASSKPRS